ncbi:MAG: 50S ribosomal protein L16 [Candidatus Lokiarchaeota archaeon]|nr:50S ribosomal protein L16 [Candidatus Lokiarchaeota archaeon]MBD3201882.1 50S ribosomal protein L16 [Candidatus Lokiarchaeota archaeon]
MAHRRPWHCYKKWNRRPYQHKRSANHRREYARGGSQSKIQRFWGGNKFKKWSEWDIVVGLRVDEQVQISSNALEAMRVAINATLLRKVGQKNYRLRVRPKPFQKFRENRMLAFAGADRVQSGMRNSFGRATGVCARVRGGQVICDVGINMKHLNIAKARLKVASYKIPCTCQIVLLKYKKPEFLKRAGLPLYDADKRREIPLYKVELAEAEN